MKCRMILCELNLFLIKNQNPKSKLQFNHLIKIITLVKLSLFCSPVLQHLAQNPSSEPSFSLCWSTKSLIVKSWGCFVL